MATDLERLVVTLEAQTAAYHKAMEKALARTDRTAGGIERRFSAMQKRVDSSFAALSRLPGLGAVAGGAGLATLVRTTDLYRDLQNQLRVTGLEGDELKSVYTALAGSAQRNYAPLASLVTLYSRASQASKELGASQTDLLSFSDNVAKALRVAGTSPGAASGALLQLSQLLGSARVQAEEFNSVNEGARPILQAVADGLIEAGGSVSKLKGLVNDGAVSNRAFFEAFQIGAQGLDAKLAGSLTTVSGAMENLKTTLTTLAGRFDEGSKSTDAFVTAISDVQRAIVELADFFEKAQPGLSAFGKWLTDVRDRINATAAAAGRLTGLDRLGRPINDLLGTADSTQMADELNTAGASVVDLEAKAKRLTEEISRLSANRLTLDTSRLREAREELEKTRAAIVGLQTAAAGASSPTTTRAIIDASPVADLPAVSVAPAPSKKPISVTAYPVGGGSDSKIAGLAKSFGTSLEQMIAAAKDAGHDIQVFSGKRTVERQAELWAAAVRKYGSEAAARKWVAPPGRSMHNAGKAADLKYSSDAARLWAHQNASSYGLSFPLGNEPWHIEPAGGRGGKRQPATETEKRAEAAKRVIDSLTAEAAAVGKTAEQRELLQSLQQAGVELSSIEGQAIAAKVAELYRLKDAQEAATTSAEELTRAREEFADMGADAVKGIVSDLRAGKSAADALRGALDRIIARMTDSLIDGLFSSLLGGSGSAGGAGILGGIGKLFGFAEGGVMTTNGPANLKRFAKGGVSTEAAIFGEAGPEAAVPLPDGRRIPVDLRAPSIGKPATSAGGRNVNLRMAIDLTGANGDATIERISRQAAAEAAQQAFREAVATSDRSFPARQKREQRLGY